MNNEFAIKLIMQPGDETTSELFDEPHAGIFWIDWREADEDIITMAADALGLKDLSPEWQAGKLFVRYKDEITAVPLEFKPGEQDKTLLSLNKALSKGYEVRHVRASEGGDSDAFMALDNESWKNLESSFGERVKDAFMPLTADNPLFS